MVFWTNLPQQGVEYAEHLIWMGRNIKMENRNPNMVMVPCSTQRQRWEKNTTRYEKMNIQHWKKEATDNHWRRSYAKPRTNFTSSGFLT